MNSIPDSHRDLLESKFATLATVGADGYPQVSEVWFLATGDTVAMSLTTGRQKTKNLMHRSVCSLLILDLVNPFRYLELRGDVKMSPDDDHAFADRMEAKYGTNPSEYDQPGDKRLVVTLHLTRVNAVDVPTS